MNKVQPTSKRITAVCYKNRFDTEFKYATEEKREQFVAHNPELVQEENMSSRRPPEINGMHSLKVDNISYNTTPADLRRMFDKYGEIGDIHIPRDRYNRQSRGFGFVRFFNRRDAEYAVDRIDGKFVDGRELRVSLARYDRPIDERYSGRRRSRSRSPRGRSRSRSPRGRSRSRSPRGKSRSRSPRGKSRSRSPRRSRSRVRDRSDSPRRRTRSRSATPKKGKKESRSRSKSRSRSGSASD